MADWIFTRAGTDSSGQLGVTPIYETAVLSDSPADFDAPSAVDLASTAAGAEYVGLADDGFSSNVRIMSGATVLAAADAGGGFEPLTANRTTSGTIATSAVSFGYVLTSASKAQWDAAVIEYEQIILKSKGWDNGHIVWSAVATNITVAYTPSAGGFVPAWAGNGNTLL
jgi:hypothetical protein